MPSAREVICQFYQTPKKLIKDKYYLRTRKHLIDSACYQMLLRSLGHLSPIMVMKKSNYWIKKQSNVLGKS